MKAEVVRHPGIVTELEGDLVRVKVLQVSACASCHAKGACSLADMEEKIVEIEGYRGRELHPGDHVTLAMQRTSGNRAVLLGYFLPFLVLMATMITGSFFIQSEGLLALVSIGILIPYYLLLYHFRDRLKKKFIISCEG
jgi:positive regulator of sigma E activity